MHLQTKVAWPHKVILARVNGALNALFPDLVLDRKTDGSEPFYYSEHFVGQLQAAHVEQLQAAVDAIKLHGVQVNDALQLPIMTAEQRADLARICNSTVGSPQAAVLSWYLNLIELLAKTGMKS